MPRLPSLRQSLAERPLSQRMVGLIVALLFVGLLLAGTVTLGVLQAHLTSQVDNRLETSAKELAEDALTRVMLGDDPSPITNEFFIYAKATDSLPQKIVRSSNVARNGEPFVDDILLPGETPDTSTGMTNPMTVHSTKAGSTWRAIVIPMGFSDGQSAGTVALALPLADVQHTLASTAFYFVIASAIIVSAGGIWGHSMVRQSLLPLRRIEAVAGRIAGGDLTQRIHPEPPTTEVGSLALSLNSMLSQIEAAFDAQQASEMRMRRFVSDASHELRTPLAAIRGYTELYGMGGVPADRTGEVMERIQSESTRMGALVEDLLTLARLDEGRKLEHSDFDLVEVARNAAFDLHALDSTRQVEVISLQGGDPPATLTVNGDRYRIQQVFTNLIGNIVRYTPEGTPVEMAVGVSGNVACAEIRDHGPGIAEADQKRVFERFYRADPSRSRELGGSGLGMSIVQQIMQAHRGSVQVSKTEGGGLTVRLELPVPGISAEG